MYGQQHGHGERDEKGWTGEEQRRLMGKRTIAGKVESLTKGYYHDYGPEGRIREKYKYKKNEVVEFILSFTLTDKKTSGDEGWPSSVLSHRDSGDVSWLL